MSQVNEAVEFMKGKFNPAAAEGMDVIFQFDIEGHGFYCLIVKDSKCDIQEGKNESANVTLIMSPETLRDLSSGELNGMQAFMAGKLKTEGDMMLAMKLADLFPVG